MSLPPEVSLVLFLPSTWAAITCGSFLRESSAELFRLVPDGTGTAFDDIEPVFQVPEADPRCRETVFRETNMSYKQHDVIRYFLPSSSDRLAYVGSSTRGPQVVFCSLNPYSDSVADAPCSNAIVSVPRSPVEYRPII